MLHCRMMPVQLQHIRCLTDAWLRHMAAPGSQTKTGDPRAALTGARNDSLPDRPGPWRKMPGRAVTLMRTLYKTVMTVV